MSAQTVALVGAMTYAHQELLPILSEHLNDNYGQVLPHLVMADVVRWLVDHQADRLDAVQAVLDWIEVAYQNGNDDVRDVIVVSGIEMIPDPGEPGAELRVLLGPNLSQADPWTP